MCVWMCDLIPPVFPPGQSKPRTRQVTNSLNTILLLGGVYIRKLQTRPLHIQALLERLNKCALNKALESRGSPPLWKASLLERPRRSWNSGMTVLEKVAERELLEEPVGTLYSGEA